MPVPKTTRPNRNSALAPEVAEPPLDFLFLFFFKSHYMKFWVSNLNVCIFLLGLDVFDSRAGPSLYMFFFFFFGFHFTHQLHKASVARRVALAFKPASASHHIAYMYIGMYLLLL